MTILLEIEAHEIIGYLDKSFNSRELNPGLVCSSRDNINNIKNIIYKSPILPVYIEYYL